MGFKVTNQGVLMKMIGGIQFKWHNFKPVTKSKGNFSYIHTYEQTLFKHDRLICKSWFYDGHGQTIHTVHIHTQINYSHIYGT
jgi:hypothetical protein